MFFPERASQFIAALPVSLELSAGGRGFCGQIHQVCLGIWKACNKLRCALSRKTGLQNPINEEILGKALTDIAAQRLNDNDPAWT
jgi:hypothetical protein